MNPYNLMCESNVEHRNSCISTSVASSMPRQCRVTPRHMRVTTAAGAAGPRQNSYARRTLVAGLVLHNFIRRC